MERYYFFKDGVMLGSAATREAAIDAIRAEQERETHPILRAEFTIIKGSPEETIPYPSQKPPRRGPKR